MNEQVLIIEKITPSAHQVIDAEYIEIESKLLNSEEVIFLDDRGYSSLALNIEHECDIKNLKGKEIEFVCKGELAVITIDATVGDERKITVTAWSDAVCLFDDKRPNQIRLDLSKLNSYFNH